MDTFLDYFIKQHDSQLLLTGNLKQADVDGQGIQDTFTKEIIKIWSDLNYEENPTHFRNLLKNLSCFKIGHVRESIMSKMYWTKTIPF